VIVKGCCSKESFPCAHRRAGHAIDHGYFRAQIVPVEVQVKKERVPFEMDETVRPGTTVERLSKLRPEFDPAGSVTAGNASSINDAAAAVVLMSRDGATKRGLKPMGRLVGYSFAGVDPKYMGIGPVPAVRSLLEKTGLGLDAIDVFEVNEAFAAPALAASPHPHLREAIDGTSEREDGARDGRIARDRSCNRRGAGA
jgi:acetyl-CoA C-acetyltransferase